MMKQQKLNDYKPHYPKKSVRGMTLAAAALLTLGTTLGCRVSNTEPQIEGAVSIDEPGVEETVPPEELQTEGLIPIDETETPEPEDAPMLLGDVAIFEP